MSEFGGLRKHEKIPACTLLIGGQMYFCTVNGNSKIMICTLSSAHWQQASKLSSPCGALSRFETTEINAPINTIQYKTYNNCSVCIYVHPSLLTFRCVFYCFNWYTRTPHPSPEPQCYVRMHHYRPTHPLLCLVKRNSYKSMPNDGSLTSRHVTCLPSTFSIVYNISHNMIMLWQWVGLRFWDIIPTRG